MMGARCVTLSARAGAIDDGAIDGAIDGLDSRDRYVPSILIDIDRYRSSIDIQILIDINGDVKVMRTDVRAREECVSRIACTVLDASSSTCRVKLYIHMDVV